MEQKITDYITHISREFNADGEIEGIIFYGYGSSPIEEFAEDTTKECLEQYIEYCNKQIEIAKACLETDKYK